MRDRFYTQAKIFLTPWEKISGPPHKPQGVFSISQILLSNAKHMQLPREACLGSCNVLSNRSHSCDSLGQYPHEGYSQGSPYLLHNLDPYLHLASRYILMIPRILLSSPHAKAVTTAPRFGNASFSGVDSSKYRQINP